MRRHLPDTRRAHPGVMTASLFVTGTGTGVQGRTLPREGAANRVAVAHAVAKPAVDGLESSVCGVLVPAAATEDWPSARHAARCEECARIAG